jgi:hypothetical protein
MSDTSTVLTGDSSLSKAIRIAQENLSLRIRVALPGKVEAYDATTHLATIKPLIRRKRTGEAAKSLASLSRVPIIHPRTSAGALFLPIAVGDLVTLLFSDRALDRWKAGTGQETTPDDPRAHDLSDCWAIPGGYPEGMVPEQRFPGAMEVWLKEGTRFAVSNGTEELVSLLYDLVTYIETQITFSNAGGPTGPPTNASLLTELKAKLEAFKAD